MSRPLAIVAAALVAACACALHPLGGEATAAPSPRVHRRLPLAHQRLGRRWMFLAPLRADLAGGYLHNLGVLEVDAGYVRAAVRAVPALRYRRGRLAVRLPLEASHRQTFGATLPETRAQGGVRVEGRPVRPLTLWAQGGGRWVWRPGWPDLYQPVVDERGERTGALRSTDRYSYRQWGASAGVAWAVGDGVELTARGQWDRRVYVRDPAFDPVIAPMHLTPGDRDRWQASAGVRWHLPAGAVAWRMRAAATFADLRYHFYFARQAGTGLTFAAPGPPPANPLQHFVRVGGRYRVSAWVRRARTRAWLALRVRFNDDRFDDYYTWTEGRAEVGLRVRPARRVRAWASYAVTYRRYTRSGYQPGPTHPALDADTVRRRWQHDVEVGASVTLWRRGPTVFAAGRWRQRDTNFPDYEPWVYPMGLPYDVDWDVRQWTVETGVRWAL